MTPLTDKESQQDVVLSSIDLVTSIGGLSGRPLLAQIEVLSALGTLASELGLEFAKGHIAAILLNMTKRG